MDAIFQDADFPMRAVGKWVVKRNGDGVALCPSEDIAVEVAMRLSASAEGATMTAEKLLANFNEVFPQGVPPGEAAPVPMVPRYDWNPLTGEPLPTQDYHQIIATWPPAVDRDKFGG